VVAKALAAAGASVVVSHLAQEEKALHFVENIEDPSGNTMVVFVVISKEDEVNVQGEDVKKMDALGDSVFTEAFEYEDIVGALVSEEQDEPKRISSDKRREKYVVLVDPIDGSSNLDVDCVVGSVFSVRRLKGTVEESILQKGSEQIAAGYIMYGPSVLLVYSAGDGLHSFVLDEQIGEFVLDH
jgi:fructose-1,6-bisphosphatase I